MTMINIYITSFTQFDFDNVFFDCSLSNCDSVMSELDNDVIDWLTEGMSIGNMVKFRECVIG